MNLVVSNENSMKIHCKCTQEYKKNNGVEENIPLTKDILKQIRDHVFHYFIKATKVGESRLRCRKNNKIWTQEEKDSMAALLFRRMPKENACLYTAWYILHHSYSQRLVCMDTHCGSLVLHLECVHFSLKSHSEIFLLGRV